MGGGSPSPKPHLIFLPTQNKGTIFYSGGEAENKGKVIGNVIQLGVGIKAVFLIPSFLNTSSFLAHDRKYLII